MNKGIVTETKWYDVPGHNFYQVSNDGKVRFDSAMNQDDPDWVDVEIYTTINGFTRVNIADPITEENKYFYVWELLLLAFKLDLARMGLFKVFHHVLSKSSGRYTGDSNIKIPDLEIARMRSLHDGPANLSLGELARMYDLNKGYVSRILNRKVRKDVDDRLADAYIQGED